MKPRYKTTEFYLSLAKGLVGPVQTAVIQAKKLGHISQEDYDEIYLPLLREGNELLFRMKVMALKGDIDEVSLIGRAVIGVVLKLQLLE